MTSCSATRHVQHMQAWLYTSDGNAICILVHHLGGMPHISLDIQMQLLCDRADDHLERTALCTEHGRLHEHQRSRRLLQHHRMANSLGHTFANL